MDILDEIDKVFDKEWRRFIRHEISKNKRWNKRLYKTIEKIRGVDFTCEIQILATIIGSEKSLIHVTREPKGVKIKERRVSLIEYIWVSGDADKGFIYVQIKENRWIKIPYSQLQ